MNQTDGVRSGKKWGCWMSAMVVVGLFSILPLGTEMNVQKAKRHLRKDRSVESWVSEFGMPTRMAEGEGRLRLAERLGIELDANDRIWVYNRQGIPYWATYLVTDDDVTIKAWVVDRFW